MKQKFFLLIFCVAIRSLLHAQSANESIRLNQLGFYPAAPKIAVVVGDNSASDFFVIDVKKKDTAFKGKLSALKQSKNSLLKTRIANFSVFQKEGAYVVSVPNLGNSYEFQIRKNVNRAVAVASLKGFYYQRGSMPLETQYAGKWARAAGHPDTAVFIHSSAATAQRPAGTIISSPSGWYDAGDYNKYIVNSGISTATLLSAYEDFPSYFNTLNTTIPESSDAVPDVLNETLYNIRWMLTMQDPNDGGVYHKCTNANFDKMIMPHEATAPRYVVQKGTAATLDFAAVMAQSSRIFSAFEKSFPGLSDSCLIAATKAWQWAEKNPAREYNQNEINKYFEPKIATGAYGDKNFSDEWFWAACELFVATRDKLYYKVIDEKMNETLSLPTWSNVYTLGYYTLIRQEKSLSNEHVPGIAKMKERLVQFADSYLQYVNENAFATVMGHSTKDFNWGSNSNAANQSIVLINAYFITKEKKYIVQALANLDYILGRNATGYCFVTGMGSKSTMHPHHRPSIADGIDEPVPGLLAGGPNPGRQDSCDYDFIEPETAYSDTDCSYASNEIAINWNAPLVYIVNAMEALQEKF